MTTAKQFRAFCQAVIGTWVGKRDTATARGETVKAVWEATLDGAFLLEHWYTPGPDGRLQLSAIAMFQVASGEPAGYVAAYRTGRVGLGDSTFARGEWVLSHRWLGAEPDADIHLRLLDGRTYEQEVRVYGPGGRREPESRAVLVRED